MIGFQSARFVQTRSFPINVTWSYGGRVPSIRNRRLVLSSQGWARGGELTWNYMSDWMYRWS
jgi:hypothetical protein